MVSFYTQSYLDYNTFVKQPDGLYLNKSSTYLNVRDEAGSFYHFELYPGFLCDGGSVPKPFQWFMPSWDDGNVLLNLAYCVHDFCYGSECLNRELADDLLRSLLRDAGYNRFHASTVCWAVNSFACCHYGKKHDKYSCRDYGKLTVI